jgi:hypothetical protein
MFLMQCLMSLAMGLSAVCDLPRCHWSGLAFGHVRNLRCVMRVALFPSILLFVGLITFCFLDFLWSGILVFVFSFGAWWEIRAIQKTARSVQIHDDQNQMTASAKKKDPLNKFKRRVLNVAIQTSACLLLNMVR